MPIYEYRCASCGHQFDVQQRFSDAPLTVCPKCQGKLSKVFHPAGVIFKGSGFYTTDYKGAGKAGSNGSAPDSDSKGGESKPESKPESKD